MKKFKVTVDGQTFDVTVEEVNDQSSAIPAAPAVEVEKETRPAVSAEKKTEPVKHSPPSAPVVQSQPVSSGGSGGTAVPAPMPGSIIDVLVQVGDTTSEGKVLVILEAMKMENEVTAPQAGTIVDVLVKKGDTVNSGDPLVLIN
jgi:glutaconyl-CoA/methylmalonyl-CoA decarboxylase subunit gamma